MNIAELVQNKQSIIAQKKAMLKQGSGIPFSGESSGTMFTIKEGANERELHIKAVINTTNVIDSHKDVHLPGLWKKSLKENKNIMLLQEHSLTFAKIIADGKDLKAYTEDTTFEELGFKTVKGNTQALVFEATLKEDRNPFMFKQYKEGIVKQHSVGMQYVKIQLAVNSTEYAEEKAVWDKYIDQVRNKKEAEDTGYFWVVQEAKVVEGSAVPLGSNPYTPTIETTGAGKSTPPQPPKGTDKRELIINFLKSF